MAFEGFPRDTQYTPTPDPLFGPLLEDIQDLAELKVTLRSIWLLHHKRQEPRAVPLDDFLTDPVLLRGIGAGSDTAKAVEEIRRGLRQSVRRGTLLVHGGNPDEAVFVLNNDAGRRALSRLKDAGAAGVSSMTASEAPAKPRERLNIFALYEDTIATLDPYIAERLKEAEQRYPPGWIREAFEIAATENKRSWRYVAAILARWGAEGKGNWAGGNKEDGEPGRNISQDRRGKYSKDYERYRGRSGSRPASR